MSYIVTAKTDNNLWFVVYAKAANRFDYSLRAAMAHKFRTKQLAEYRIALLKLKIMFPIVFEVHEVAA